jgi:RNA polymerase primary sigma factor
VDNATDTNESPSFFEIKQQLLQQGKEEGVLYLSDVFDRFAPIDCSDDDIQGFLNDAANVGINVVDDQNEEEADVDVDDIFATIHANEGPQKKVEKNRSSPSVSKRDLDELSSRLIDIASRQGNALTDALIQEESASLAISPDDFSYLLSSLSSAGVNVVFEDEDIDEANPTLDELRDISEAIGEPSNKSGQEEAVPSSRGPAPSASENGPDYDMNAICTLYTQEAHRFPRLNAKQERELSRRIIEGEKAAVEKSNPSFNETERKNLDYIIQDGLDARSSLTSSNLMLVYSIARKYCGHGLEFMDLIGFGNMGLIKAADRFDYTKGFRFTTYATWWITQAITRAIGDEGRLIRVPIHMHEKMVSVLKARTEFEKKNGRLPSTKELAKALNGRLSEGRLEELISFSKPVLSIDEIAERQSEASDDVFDTIYDEIPDTGNKTPVEAVCYIEAINTLHSLLLNLNPRSAEIIIDRYGLGDRHAETLEEIGAEEGVTRERIRQIEAKALKMLRHPTRKNILSLALYGYYTSPSGKEIVRDDSSGGPQKRAKYAKEPEPTQEDSEAEDLSFSTAAAMSEEVEPPTPVAPVLPAITLASEKPSSNDALNMSFKPILGSDLTVSLEFPEQKTTKNKHPASESSAVEKKPRKESRLKPLHADGSSIDEAPQEEKKITKTESEGGAAKLYINAAVGELNNLGSGFDGGQDQTKRSENRGLGNSASIKPTLPIQEPVPSIGQKPTFANDELIALFVHSVKAVRPQLVEVDNDTRMGFRDSDTPLGSTLWFWIDCMIDGSYRLSYREKASPTYPPERIELNSKTFKTALSTLEHYLMQ